MPNHCFNRVHITGDPDDIAAITAALIGPNDNTTIETITFTKLCPQPPDMSLAPQPPNATNGWYEWRLAHWGTKWDAYDVDITDRDDETLAFTCSTAWEPPSAFVETLREQYPNVSISWFYDEPGNEIAGYL